MIGPVSSLSLDLLQYLQSNPHASDTLAHITGWWIMQHRIKAIATDVKDALDELVDLNLVLQTKRRYDQPLYALNLQKLSQVHALLKCP